jgi:hypothetical protein
MFFFQELTLKTLSVDTALIVCDQGDYLAGEEERRVRGQFC